MPENLLHFLGISNKHRSASTKLVFSVCMCMCLCFMGKKIYERKRIEMTDVVRMSGCKNEDYLCSSLARKNWNIQRKFPALRFPKNNEDLYWTSQLKFLSEFLFKTIEFSSLTSEMLLKPAPVLAMVQKFITLNCKPTRLGRDSGHVQLCGSQKK